VAYSSLLQERRRTLHARIVKAMEALAPDRMAEQVERLAYHALHGEVWEKALAYFRQAGDKALARSAHREAMGYFEQALGALRHLPEQRDIREQAVDLRLALRTALGPSGNLGRSLSNLREAKTLAVALDDSRRLGRVLLFLANHCNQVGEYDQAIAAAQRALALTAAGGDVVLRANQYLGQAYEAQGNYRRAIDYTVASLDRTRRHERFDQMFLPAVV
jgi:predicted ATPase